MSPARDMGPSAGWFRPQCGSVIPRASSGTTLGVHLRRFAGRCTRRHRSADRGATMAFREVRVFEVREVLRVWLGGPGFRSIERLVGVDRKTVRRYVEAAAELGLDRDG